jgi:hypothetical protein
LALDEHRLRFGEGSHDLGSHATRLAALLLGRPRPYNDVGRTHWEETMRITKGLGMLLLAIWLIVWGILNLGIIDFAGSGVILAVLALAAGVILLIRR